MLESDLSGTCTEPQSRAESTPKLVLDDNNIPRLPPPASSRGHLRSRTAVDIPPLYSRSPSHSPTRSSTFLPFFGSSRSSSPLRRPAEITRDAAEFSVDESEETSSQAPSSIRKRQRPKGVERIQSWFEGSSEPVTIGLVASPRKEQGGEEEVVETMFSRSQEMVPTTHTVSPRPSTSIMQSANNSTSRFSFFRKQAVAPVRHDPDELEGMNVRDTLFPEGPPDEFSAAAFKNLEQNAEGALKMFQQAWIEAIAVTRKAASDKNALADDLDASTTRSEHLKQQLLEMAERAAKQEKLLASLQAENEQMRANETALRSIRVIDDQTSELTALPPRSRRNRSSDISYTDSIESATTDPESVFSHANDDARTPGTSVGCPSPTLPVVKHACRVVTPSVHTDPQSAHLRSLTTNVMVAVPECQNCHGLRASEAWDVLGVMKAESVALKARIEMLERANEGALSLLTLLAPSSDSADHDARCKKIVGGRAGLSAMDDTIVQEADEEDYKKSQEMTGCIC